MDGNAEWHAVACIADGGNLSQRLESHKVRDAAKWHRLTRNDTDGEALWKVEAGQKITMQSQLEVPPAGALPSA